ACETPKNTTDSTKTEATNHATANVNTGTTQPLQGIEYNPNEVFDGKKITKTAAEWRELLTEDQFLILRQHGTEPARSGEYEKNKRKGVYYCAACGLPLFHSKTKFESGTGWPSYFKPINEKNVGSTNDNSYGMDRTEVHCN